MALHLLEDRCKGMNVDSKDAILLAPVAEKYDVDAVEGKNNNRAGHWGFA